MLQHFPKLKSPEDFSKRFGIHWGKYKDKMLSFYNPTFGKIHTSLTILDPVETKEATHLFKNVFGIMGDKTYTSQVIDGLLQDLLQQGLQNTDLRDEIFCLVCKQLTNNPKEESVDRGWNLMSLLLATFRPSSEMENYLENFLRRAGKDECVKVLHKTRITGSLTIAPSLEELAPLRTVGRIELWLNGQRENISLNSSDWDAQSRPDQEKCLWENVVFDSIDSDPVPMANPDITQKKHAPPPPMTNPDITQKKHAPPPPPKSSGNHPVGQPKASALPPPPPKSGGNHPVPPPPSRGTHSVKQPPPPPPKRH